MKIIPSSVFRTRFKEVFDLAASGEDVYIHRKGKIFILKLDVYEVNLKPKQGIITKYKEKES